MPAGADVAAAKRAATIVVDGSQVGLEAATLEVATVILRAVGHAPAGTRPGPGHFLQRGGSLGSMSIDVRLRYRSRLRTLPSER